MEALKNLVTDPKGSAKAYVAFVVSAVVLFVTGNQDAVINILVAVLTGAATWLVPNNPDE